MSTNANRHPAPLGVIVLLLSGMAVPHAQPRSQVSLASVTSLHCRFPLYATGTWADGEPQANVKPAELSFSFEAIDADLGVADAIGLFGPSHVVAQLSEAGLHFLQIGRTGPLYVTTVFAARSREDQLMAVHTRHEYTPASVPGFTSRPEQYYGECEAGP